MARLTVPRGALLVTAALLLTYVFVIAPGTSGQPTQPSPDRVANAEPGPTATATPSPPPRPPFPPAGRTFVGVATREGPYDFRAVDDFTAATRHAPQVMLFSVGWTSGPFDRALFDRIRDRGMLPMLAWEPWDHRLDEAALRNQIATAQMNRERATQPRYRLSRIAAGDFDDYLRSWAEGIRSLDYPVAIRFAHEMNGDWYPWCERANGNRPGDYVRAWRHVHDLFRSAGATNVTWVWSPNARWNNSAPTLHAYYPGDDYVDWLGISGYYGMGAFATYRSFDQIFRATIVQLRTFSHRPMVITETAATDAGGHKARWITEAFRSLPRYPELIGLIWFEVDKEVDWRVAGSPASARAFAQAVADPRYALTWTPDSVARTRTGD
ncbi:glycoside hydrolase family 26 protein [Micromonospora siamensis]|uniref:Glycosyl hydrolase family 26 n=1 Tax=Micromonospora siamensis TaxID=299152 RepID=A0A1C5IA78_9ACTN|nr:glycosyl hydrolase [Micromonospora siamensis]SCG54851.1 Glycosyl hydrolase family 26 [Micromonospora siamensis]